MKTLKFEGGSDDTFGEYGITHQEVDSCSKNTPIQCVISSKEGSLVIIGHYHLHPTDGCWTIGIAQLKENELIPAWDTRFKIEHCGYSPVLEIDVPDDFKLTWYNDGELMND